MDNGRNMFFDFIMERTQDDKKEEMQAAIAEHFKPPQEGGGFDPEAFRKGIEVITSMLKPEAVPEFQQRMRPPAMDDGGNPPEIINALVQPDSLKWQDDMPDGTTEEMREAFACSKNADKMTCDCWNTGCTFFGQCKKCIVFHLCLDQFPTCHRSFLKEHEDHYIIFSQDVNK